MDVSRLTNAPKCVSCNKRPQRWSGGRWQSYCTECRTEYGRHRRAGMVEVLLTPEEWAQVKRARKARVTRNEVVQ